MSEEVSREILLEIASEFYHGDLLSHVRKNLTPKKPLVAQLFDKLVDNFRVNHPERNYDFGPREQAKCMQSNERYVLNYVE